jgi:hypothetical protein
MRCIRSLLLFFLLLPGVSSVMAQTPAVSPPTGAGSAPAPENAAIQVGTIITVQNWKQYQDFMPDGMAQLFAGQYSLKIPPDVQMEIGPTLIHPLPNSYVDATEKYSGQIQLVELPDGGLTVKGYQGGTPFPNPSDPHKGWKVLANLWYRYMPYLAVDTNGNGCVTSNGSGINCKAVVILNRQLAFLTDPGVPSKVPDSGDKFYAQWLMVTEPEQSRYTATLTISYEDLTRDEDSYIFLPALRRYQPISTLARCSPNQGTDSTQEEYRFGFDSNLSELSVDFVATKKIVMLLPDSPPAHFPDDFDMPLGWPKPSWGKWQVRDVDVISVAKLPARAQGYCYGKRVMYIDRTSSAPLWEDLYDSQMHLWRLYGMFLHPREVPNVGVVDASTQMIYSFWDVQNSHATFFIEPADNRPYYLNEQAPKDYFDLRRYTEPSGLNLIMR